MTSHHINGPASRLPGGGYSREAAPVVSCFTCRTAGGCITTEHASVKRARFARKHAVIAPAFGMYAAQRRSASGVQAAASACVYADAIGADAKKSAALANTNRIRMSSPFCSAGQQAFENHA
jgi:hypothetical protein